MSLMPEEMFVVATYKIQGFHNWPDAKGEVDFLSFKHRHLFHIKVVARVSHDNRDVEILDMQTLIIEAIAANYEAERLGVLFESDSCEQIARKIALTLMEDNLRIAEVEVLEDGENGAILRYNPHA